VLKKELIYLWMRLLRREQGQKVALQALPLVQIHHQEELLNDAFIHSPALALYKAVSSERIIEFY